MVAFIVMPYINSYIFYERYVAFQNAIKDLKPSQEYACLDDAIAYRRELIKYQQKFEEYGIFAPYYSPLKDIKPIELVNYQLENYG